MTAVSHGHAEVRTPAPLSEQEYRRLAPLNKRHRWLVNRVSAARMVPAVAEHLPRALCTVSIENGDLAVTRLPGCPVGTPAGPEALSHLLRTLGAVRVRPVGWGTGDGQLLEADGDGYRVQGRRATLDDILAVLRIVSAGRRCVVTEAWDQARCDLVRVHLGRSHRQATVLQLDVLRSGDAADTPADDLTSTASLPLGLVGSLERTFSDPEARFRFISVDVLVAPDGTWSIEQIDANPAYPAHGFTEQARRFLGKRAKRRRAQEAQAEVERQDAETAGAASAAERRFAQKHGFSVDMIRRFGIDRDNVHKFVSERVHRKAQPFNGPGAARAVRHLGADTDAAAQRLDLRQEQQAVLARVADAGGALLGPSSWDADAVWRVDVGHNPADTTEATNTSETLGTPVTVNGIGYSEDEFARLMRARTRTEPMSLITAGTSAAARPRRFSTTGSVQIRISMIHEPGTTPVVGDAFVVGHHDRKARKAFRSEGHLVGTEQAGRTAPDQDTTHEAALDHLAAGEAAGIDVWPEGLRDLSGIDLVGRIHPRTGRVESARAMIGTELYEYTLHPVTHEPLHGQIRGWDALVTDLTHLCETNPDLHYVEFTAVVTTHGHRILGCSLTPDYPSCYAYSVPTVDYLHRAAKAAKARRKRS